MSYKYPQEESMEPKLYVGNLSYQTTEDDLRTMFAQAGTVVDVALIKDRDTGQSKGFAFVQMANQAEAEQAIKLFDGKSLGDREIKVNMARPREENRSGSRGGGSGYRDRSRRPGGGGSRRY
jgi:RNA recognition motif-containing protein